jgi:hypothetical protein
MQQDYSWRTLTLAWRSIRFSVDHDFMAGHLVVKSVRITGTDGPEYFLINSSGVIPDTRSIWPRGQVKSKYTGFADARHQ